MWLTSHVAVALAWAGGYSSDWNPSLGISICHGYGPRKDKKTKKKPKKQKTKKTQDYSSENGMNNAYRMKKRTSQAEVILNLDTKT